MSLTILLNQMQISEPRFVRMATTCQLRDSSADAHNVMLSCLECHMCGDRTCFVTTGMPQNVRMENPGDAASTRTCTNLDAKRSEGASGGGKDLSHRPSSTMKTSYHRGCHPTERTPPTRKTPYQSTNRAPSRFHRNARRTCTGSDIKIKPGGSTVSVHSGRVIIRSQTLATTHLKRPLTLTAP